MRKHTPVLLEEFLDALPEGCDTFLDGTFGHAGHSSAIIQQAKSNNQHIHVVGVDRDEQMINKAKIFIQEQGYTDDIHIVHGSYADFTQIVEQTGIEKFDYMLLDLGVNMDHFKEADRGFSIKLDGELDMRFDTSTGIPVREWLQKTHFDQMNELFEKYTDFGQKYREGIVRDLLVARKKQPFSTTHDVRRRAKGIGLNDKKLAVIFQAWRIYINNELGELVDFLTGCTNYLNPGGRCAIMTYHSGEDRIVKYSFKELVDKGLGKLYNKKVIKPTRKECERNKAARSAKMRIFELHT